MKDNELDGKLTSGVFSPTMQKAIGFFRVAVETGDSRQVEISKKQLDAKVVRLPFVSNGKVLLS